MSYAVEVRELTKAYGELLAVDKLNLEIPEGICFGVLGPNGAGKTSFLEMIEGISKPTSGEIFVKGMDMRHNLSKIQAMMGVQLQENHFFRFLSLERILKFFIKAWSGSMANAGDLLERVGLSDKAKQQFVELSGGQKQRFALAVALANDPQIIFFDEPTTGLDPQNRRYIWDLITDLKSRNKTIVLTTHYMEEAERLCDVLVIMDHGRVIARGTPQELISQIKGNNSIWLETDTPLDGGDFQALSAVEQYHAAAHGKGWRLWTKNLPTAIAEVQELLKSRNADGVHLEINKVTLEDVFLSLTGKELRE